MPVADTTATCTLCCWRVKTESYDMAALRYLDHMHQIHGKPTANDLDYLKTEKIVWERETAK